jgi:hypothetical protein
MVGKSVSVTRVLPISKVIVDADLYPREQYNFQTAYGYSQAMLAGANFPPIMVALSEGKYYLVDGNHRIEAIKLLKGKEIEAEVVVGWSRHRIFEEAVTRNISHGRALTVHEKRVAALKLRNWKYPPNKISELIQVPLDKLNNFIEQRLINAITGETIATAGRPSIQTSVPMIVKSGIKNVAQLENISAQTAKDIKKMQMHVYSGSQQSLLRQLIGIIKAGLLDTENREIRHLIKVLKELL